MPEWFREYLKSLDSEKQNDLWEYFDGEPYLASDLIDAITEASSAASS